VWFKNRISVILVIHLYTFAAVKKEKHVYISITLKLIFFSGCISSDMLYKKLKLKENGKEKI